MKVVLLAGGFGTRISEESDFKPKPMIEIGGKPVLWHIMKLYSHYGFNDFIVCCGYKAYIIKEYFYHYYLHQADVTFDFANNNERVIHSHTAEPWRVTLVDTGMDTMTGGRLKRVRKYVGDETFMMTYGDGVSDIDIGKLIAFHKAHGAIATLSAVQPSGRFGALSINQGDTITSFIEKPKDGGSWVNAGFFVLEPAAIDYIEGDATLWEGEPLVRLASEGNLKAYRHHGFWKPMDTLRDKNELEGLWKAERAPWKVWA
ncbi:MAG TPA: glucose-1-phosphate cytidylyltransferase [Spirochaetota bacterium]|nr:glucose-1-phosphate cytidylyltransferase [Spirochaetota bacterium]